jgi:hypothetical protein
MGPLLPAMLATLQQDWQHADAVVAESLPAHRHGFGAVDSFGHGRSRASASSLETSRSKRASAPDGNSAG